MARFHGKVGFVMPAVETSKGVWKEEVVERTYFGDVIRNTRQLRDTEKVNNDLNVTNSISIMADAHASEHINAIRYVEWVGTLWEVPDVDVQSPRLLLRLGGVYNGPKPPEAPEPA